MTVQKQDNFYLDGVKSRYLYDTVIVSDYSRPTGLPIPDDHPCIQTVPKDKWDSSVYNTGVWRRCLAKWRIENNKLYLSSLVGQYKLSSVNKIFADWISVDIILGNGRFLRNISYSEYQYTHFLKIERGVILERKVLTKSYEPVTRHSMCGPTIHSSIQLRRFIDTE